MLWKHYHNLAKSRFSNKSKIDTFVENAPSPESSSTHYKIYNRFKNFILPCPSKIECSLTDLILKRKTDRTNSSTDISLQKISNILFYSVGEIDASANGGLGRRAIASGGAKFPLETYVLSMQKINELPLGLFHYRVDNHGLEHIREMVNNDTLNKLFIYPWSINFNYCIIITAVFDRNVQRYAEKGYQIVLLEAGAAGQAIQNASVAQNIASVILSGVYDDTLEQFLGIDGVSESVVNAILLR